MTLLFRTYVLTGIVLRRNWFISTTKYYSIVKEGWNLFINYIIVQRDKNILVLYRKWRNSSERSSVTSTRLKSWAFFRRNRKDSYLGFGRSSEEYSWIKKMEHRCNLQLVLAWRLGISIPRKRRDRVGALPLTRQLAHHHRNHQGSYRGVGTNSP